jgi:hypothetical protein
VAVLQRAWEEVHCRGADEAGHEQVAGPLIQLLGGADLLNDPGAHDRDPVAEGHGLGLVVGDVDGGGAELVLEPGHGGPHLHPQLGVQVGQRLVHQERLGVADDRPAHGDPLALAAGQVGRLAVQQTVQLQQLGRLVDLAVDLGPVEMGQLEPEGHVLPHRHVGVQGVALEHHGDVAVLGGELVDHPAADADLALADVLQPGHHVQAGRLPAAGGADEDDELAVGDVEVGVGDGRGAVWEPLGDVV